MGENRRKYYVTTKPRIDRRQTISDLNDIRYGRIAPGTEQFADALEDGVTLIEEMAWREETGLWQEDYPDTEELHTEVN